METPCPHSIPVFFFSSCASSPSSSSNPFSFRLWGNPSSSLPISTCFAECLWHKPSWEDTVWWCPVQTSLFPHSSLRPWGRAQPLTRTLWEPCGAAGRRTSTCCAPTLLWLLTTTTHSHTGRGEPWSGALGTGASLSYSS